MDSAFLNDKENEIMFHLREAYSGIVELGIEANQAELASGIHTAQMFLMMRALHRMEPDYWNNWFEDV